MIFQRKGSGVSWLLVGLGNPGFKYESTRHNMGFLAVDGLARRKGFRFNKLRFRAWTAEWMVNGEKVLVMKPQTYMNLSGEAVGEAARFYKIPSDHVLVIYDDVSLPLGKLRIRDKGSAGGHNGLKNIIALLGTDQFPRIRIGVGAAPHPDYDMADWVMGVPRGEDAAALEKAEERAADAAGKAALRDRVTRELYAKRCAQAKDRAEKELVWQLGDEVTGPVPKRLEAGNYFAEQRQFNLSLQANGINFDQFLAVRGQTVEQFRQWLHQQAERKLRSWLGLLLVAEREGLQPTEAEVNAALADWDEKLDGERTFPANDARKVRQRLARAKAAAFVVAHSTLTPPPAEPLVQEPEAK